MADEVIRMARKDDVDAEAASTSASAAATSETNAADSASAASTSASEAANSADAAAQSAEDAETAANRVPDPETSNDYIRGAGDETYERRTPAQVRGDIDVYSKEGVDNAVEGAVGKVIVSGTNPGNVGQFRLWMDTSGTNPRLRQRNEANDDWVDVAEHDGGQWRPFMGGEARETGTAATQIPTNADLPNSSSAGTQSDHDEPEGVEKLARLDRLAASDGFPFVAMPLVDGNPIVESGSNSDGKWVRYADGTQIVMRLDSVDLTTINPQSFDMPRYFVSDSFSSHSFTGDPGSVVSGNGLAIANSYTASTRSSLVRGDDTWTFRGDDTGNTTSRPIRMIAIGRWLE